MKVNNTGRGATEIVRNLNPRISSGPNQNTADGGGAQSDCQVQSNKHTEGSKI